MGNYYLYILSSNSKTRFYVGHKDDLEQRLEEHNRGLVRSTRPYRPWERIYFEAFGSRSEAMKRENEIKSWKSSKKIRELIELA